MKKLLLVVALATTCLTARTVSAQSTVVLPQVKNAGGANVPSQASVITGSDGLEKGTPTNPIFVTGGGGGGGGGGDASAYYQQQQITQETLYNTRLGDITAPAAGTVNARLGQVVTALGSPFQVGGSIGNTFFGARLQDATGAAFGTAGNPIYISGGGGGGGSTVTAPAGASSTTAVPVQSVTGGALALDATANALFKAGQSIGNTAFGISGTLPAFAAAPTVNLGTLGTKTSANSLSIVIASDGPGSSAGTPLYTTATGGSSGTVAQSSATSGQAGMLGQGAVTSAAPSYTTGNTNPFSLTTAGALRVDGSGTTQPVSGTVSISNLPTTQAVSNAGTFAVQASQATAANLNATVVGTGTFAAQVTSSALPTGGATSALQTTGNTSLGTIAGVVATSGATAPTTAQQISGVTPSGTVKPLATGALGGLLPGQGVPTSTRTTLTASTITTIDTARTGRLALTVTVEAALTANLFLCAGGQSTTCSATVYDGLVPSGATAGSVYTFVFAPNTAIYAFSTGTPIVNTTSWIGQ
ncbi:hypothetical protein [Sphingomonas sp. UYP23]